MRDLIDQIDLWLKSGQSVAIATVIKTWGSSPRPAGAGMAISDLKEIAGSVSGGCVEGAVIDAALEVIESGNPIRLHFGVGDEMAWEVGLSCGGEIDVFVRKFDQDQLELWKKALSSSEPVYMTLVVEGLEPYLGVESLVKSMEDIKIGNRSDASRQNLDLIDSYQSDGIYPVEKPEVKQVFIHKIKPAPELVLVGGAHIAIPLAELAKTVGFEVIVIDPRKLFSTEQRFPDIKLLLAEWPDQAFKKITITASTAVVMLTHDPKIDDPALMIALDSPAFYVGALGSRKTHQKRVNRLKSVGLDQEKIDRIHAPVGLDLGGKTPPVIALGILAEILQAWNGR